PRFCLCGATICRYGDRGGSVAGGFVIRGGELTTTSPFVSGAHEPITATDDELRAALAEAEVPPLLPALAYATGDLSLLRPELRCDPLLMTMPQGGLTEEQQATARQLAFEALVRFRDGG